MEKMQTTECFVQLISLPGPPRAVLGSFQLLSNFLPLSPWAALAWEAQRREDSGGGETA